MGQGSGAVTEAVPGARKEQPIGSSKARKKTVRKGQFRSINVKQMGNHSKGSAVLKTHDTNLFQRYRFNSNSLRAGDELDD